MSDTPRPKLMPVSEYLKKVKTVVDHAVEIGTSFIVVGNPISVWAYRFANLTWFLTIALLILMWPLRRVLDAISLFLGVKEALGAELFTVLLNTGQFMLVVLLLLQAIAALMTPHELLKKDRRNSMICAFFVAALFIVVVGWNNTPLSWQEKFFWITALAVAIIDVVFVQLILRHFLGKYEALQAIAAEARGALNIGGDTVVPVPGAAPGAVQACAAEGAPYHGTKAFWDSLPPDVTEVEIKKERVYSTQPPPAAAAA